MRAWIQDFGRKAKNEGDETRCELLDLFHESIRHLNMKDAQRQFDVSEEGRVLARRIGEPWFVLLFAHGKALARAALQDYRGAINEAVSATALVKEHAEYPMRFCIFQDLVAAFLAVDAQGYAKEIASILGHMTDELTPGATCYWCFNSCGIFYSLAVDQLDEAERRVMDRLADQEIDRTTEKEVRVECFLTLCRLSYRRRDWHCLKKWASAVHEQTDCREPMKLAETQLWTAISLHINGNQTEARQLCRSAISRAARARKRLSAALYEALSGFHELEGNHDRARRVRRGQLEAIRGRGMPGYECVVQLEICRLTALLGKNAEKELAKAKEFAARLKNPQAYLSRLSELDTSR